MSEMTEFEEKLLEGIATLSNTMLKLLAFFEAKVPDLEYRGETEDGAKDELDSSTPVGFTLKVKGAPDKSDSKPQTRVEEEFLQDLTNVMIVAESPKAMLVVKNGYQKWVAFSLIHAPKTYDLGGTYDIILRKKKGDEKSDPDNWYHTKPWEKYTPQKGGK